MGPAVGVGVPHPQRRLTDTQIPHSKIGIRLRFAITYLYRSDAGWLAMRDQRPDEFARAVAFDRAFRTAPGLHDQRYLHPSRRPLDQAPLGRIGPRQSAARQTSLLDDC
jgi:hypothetical protein